MGKTTRQIETVISAKDEFTSVFGRAEHAVNKFGEKVGKAADKMMSFKAVGIAALAALGGVSYAIYESIKASNEAIASETKLTIALGHSSSALIEQATALQKVTQYGDDQINSAQASIAAFTKDENAIKALTAATLDLATAKGMDLVSAGDLVAKSYGSSTNALARYGIEINTAANETEKLKQLTEGISNLYGGQAAAAGATFAGRMMQLKNAFGDLQEEVGFLATKNNVAITALSLLTSVFERLSAWVSQNRDDLMNYVKSGLVFTTEAVGYAVETLRFFHNAWLGFKTTWAFIGVGIADISTEIFKGIRLVLAPLDLLFEGLVALGTLKVNPLKSLQEGLDQFKGSSRDVLESNLEQIESVNGAYDSIKGSVNGITDSLKATSVEQTALALNVADKSPKISAHYEEISKKIEEVQTSMSQMLVQSRLGVSYFESDVQRQINAIVKLGATEAQLADMRSVLYEKEILARSIKIDQIIQKERVKNEQIAGLEAFAVQQSYVFMGMQIANEEQFNELSAAGDTFRAGIKGKAYQAMQDQMLRYIETGKFSLGAFAYIVAQQTKIELAGLAAKAAVNALFYTAVGLGYTALGQAANATAAFAAAGTFASVAGATLAAAAGVQALVGGTATQSAPGTPGGAPIETTSNLVPALTNQSSVTTQNVTINIQTLDGVVPQSTIDSIVDGLNNAGRRNVLINSDVISPV